MNARDLVPWSRGDRKRGPATLSDSISPVMNLHREMNRLFADMFHGFDLEETDKEYRVAAELPGLGERDVEVKGCEALVRWRHPQRGFIPPRGLRFACRADGRDQRHHGVGFVPPTDVADPHFADQVINLLSQSAAPAGRLLFEVTGSRATKDLPATVRMIDEPQPAVVESTV